MSHATVVFWNHHRLNWKNGTLAAAGREEVAGWKLCLYAGLSLVAGTSAVLADQLDPQQIGVIKETAASICNTVKEAKGQKTDVQLQGDVRGQLNGLVGRLVGAGASGTGTLTHDEFEGLTQDATAIAILGDRDCRERLFNKMFDKLTAAPAPNPIPVIADADSGWVDGGTYPGEPYCERQQKAVQAKYPGFNIAMQKSEGHRAEYNPFKHDIYRYQCSFSATAK